MPININWKSPRVATITALLAISIVGISLGIVVSKFSFEVPLILVLGIIVFILTLVNTEAGLAILIFSMLLSPEIIVGEVPGRDIVIRIDDLLLIIITFAWMAKTAINKGLALFKKTPLNKAIGVYAMVCVIATLKGILLGYVVPEKGILYTLRYIEYFLLYILVVNHIHSRKQIKFFLGAFFITCAIVSVYGLIQIPQGIRVSAPFEGTTGEPNTFGGYLLFIFCLALGLSLKKVPRNLKYALAGLIILITFPFLYTLSRASYLAIIFSFLTFILFSKKKIVLITVMVTISVSVILIKPETVLERVQYTFKFEDESLARVGGIYLDYSSSARIFSWVDSFNTWKKHPILGRGITGFAFLDGQYIRILPEMGIIGFFAFLWLLWTIYKNSVGIYKQMDDNLYKGLTLGFIAGFIGLAIHALTANTFILLRVMEPFWFIAGIIMMLPKVKEEEEIEIERIEKKKKKEEVKKIKEEERKEKEEKEEEEEEKEGIGGGWHWDY
jgi:O-antigen ligase